MEKKTENRPVAIRISGVKKMYRLGQIGGGTLTADLQSWWARIRGKEDPNTMVGTEQRLKGQSFMALNGVDLTVYKGEALGIIGTNGAGKSTLLKLLSRVTAPSEGEIEINGRIASMLEVGTGFHGEMTGRENVYLNGAILGMTKAEIDAKMDQIIEFSEIGDFIDTPVKRYSSGMYVKLAFSVAAHLDSEIMIMDEVLAVGDMKFQKKCLSRMGDAAGTEGRTVLYVSHNMNTIRRLCTRCVVLSQGRIIYDGDVETAIRIYLESNTASMGTEIDLSNSRMKHLPHMIPAKIMQLTLTGKTEPVYEFHEDINFEIKVHAHKAVKHPCVRLEIRADDDVPVGAAYWHDLPAIAADETVSFSFNLKNRGIVPGRYKTCLVLYEVNEYGTYEDLDAVFPGCTFEIMDRNQAVKLSWNRGCWGRICLNDER